MNRLFHKFILAAEPAAFTFILQLCLQNPQKLLTDIRVMNRTGHLHAPPQIPCHQIRRGNIQFCLFSAPEAVKGIQSYLGADFYTNSMRKFDYLQSYLGAGLGG